MIIHGWMSHDEACSRGLPHGLGVERLEHDPGQSLAAGLGVEWGLCEENRVPLPRRDRPPPGPKSQPHPPGEKINGAQGKSKLGVTESQQLPFFSLSFFWVTRTVPQMGHEEEALSSRHCAKPLRTSDGAFRSTSWNVWRHTCSIASQSVTKLRSIGLNSKPQIRTTSCQVRQFQISTELQAP